MEMENVRCEASRHFRNKKKEYLKAKFDELETDSKMKNIRDLYRGISDFKKAYQPRTHRVKDEKVIWLPTPTVFWLGGRTIFLSCSIHSFIHSFISHSVNPYKVINNLKDIELVILLMLKMYSIGK